MVGYRVATLVGCVCSLALAGCGSLYGDKTQATIDVRNHCGEPVTVAIGDGYDLRRDAEEFADFSRLIADGEATSAASLDTTGSFYVVAVGTTGAEVLTRVSKTMDATLELRDELCP